MFNIFLISLNENILKLDLSNIDISSGFGSAIKILILLTILSIAPAIILMTTSFTRIIVVLSFVRQSIGTQTMPPNQVIIGLALFLTMFSMNPVFEKINANVIKPYMEKKIDEIQAIDKAIIPIKNFMIKETRKSDLALFYSLTDLDMPYDKKEIPLHLIIPAFMISELKTAFQIGFLIYIPFLIIDMVISSILMAMGMMMLPPTIVSFPFKLILFVIIDGWSLIVDSLMKSFN